MNATERAALVKRLRFAMGHPNGAAVAAANLIVADGEWQIAYSAELKETYERIASLEAALRFMSEKVVKRIWEPNMRGATIKAAVAKADAALLTTEASDEG